MSINIPFIKPRVANRRRHAVQAPTPGESVWEREDGHVAADASNAEEGESMASGWLGGREIARSAPGADRRAGGQEDPYQPERPAGPGALDVTNIQTPGKR